MKVKRQIWSLPIISAVVFSLGLAVSAYFTISALNTIKQTGEVDYPVLSEAESLRSEVQTISEELKNAVLEGDKKRLDQVDERAAKLSERFKSFSAIPGQKSRGERVSKEFDEYYVQAKAAARIMLEIEKGDVTSSIAKMQTSFNVLSGDLDVVLADSKIQFKTGIESSHNSVRTVLVVSIAVAVIVITLLAITSYFVIHAIWKQLGGEPEYAREIAQAVASGDLSINIEFDPKHKNSLLAALVEMKTRLERIVSEIKYSAEEIKGASGEIASGNSDLSARTEIQANNLGNAAQSMAELTAAVQKNAESALHANKLAATASTVATRGGQAVSQVVDTMNEISSSAKRISDITNVIDGIAFQTNILALNAAVEAARAGEQGRGFAVVASEVRNLAQRSAGAAKEIKELIVESVDKVNAGTHLVADAGRTMEEIVVAVRSVTQLISEISFSSQEQSSGLENLSRSVNEMDDSTQRNASMTEEATAAAKSLQQQAMQLSDAVGVFKLSDGAAPAVEGRPLLSLS